MGKLDINKPLPRHTKLDYYECYAKKVLEDLFPEQFINLKLSDKPDLQDVQNSIGVEVTIAEDSKTLEAESLYSQLWCGDECDRAKYIERIQQCGASYEKGILLSSGSDNFRLINRAIKSKVEKLIKAEYRALDEYQLFVFSSICANDIMLKNELDYLLERKITNYFRKIYILVPGALFYFNLRKRIYQVFSIDSNRQHQQAQTARQIVEKGEPDDRT